jgi:hypothetical protein
VPERLDIAEIIDAETDGRIPGSDISIGTPLGPGHARPGGRATLEGRVRRLVGEHHGDAIREDPRSGAGAPPPLDAIHLVTPKQLEQIEHCIALRMVELFGLDVSSFAPDTTNFATYIDSTNTRAPIAQRGKARKKRADLRLAGPGLVVTCDGGIALAAHAYPGNRPDVTQFPRHDRYPDVPVHHARTSETDPQVTVLFDAGQDLATTSPI